MATNKEILAARARKAALKAEAKELKRTIDRSTARLEKVNALLGLANAVDEVVGGVAIKVYSDTNTVFEMHTIAQGPNIMPRDVQAYKVANSDNWAVRVNGGPRDRPLFFGGEVLGLNRDWTRSEAREIAKRWLTGDESVLVA